MDHQTKDQLSLAIAEAIAQELPNRPEWVQRAKENLERWERRNSGTPSLARCYQEWRQILARPLVEVIATLIARTDEGQRLRQNSPFTGTLSRQEIERIRRRFTHGSITV